MPSKSLPPSGCSSGMESSDSESSLTCKETVFGCVSPHQRFFWADPDERSDLSQGTQFG